jgi:hypothetical protein
MNAEMIRKYAILLGMALIIVAVPFVLFFRLYQKDVKVLTDFPTAYQIFDHAISNFSTAVHTSKQADLSATDDLERKAEQALVELRTKASARISSLIKNDADVMRTMPEIGDLSAKELDALKAYKKAAGDKGADLNQLDQELASLTKERESAYAHFQELAAP